MPSAATWMDPETVILCEVNETKTNNTWYHFYVESTKMVQINLFSKQKQSHRCRKQTTVTRGMRESDILGDEDWHIHTIVCKTDNSAHFTVFFHVKRKDISDELNKPLEINEQHN